MTSSVGHNSLTMLHQVVIENKKSLIPSFGGGAEFGENRSIKKIWIFAPQNTPLLNFFQTYQTELINALISTNMILSKQMHDNLQVGEKCKGESDCCYAVNIDNHSGKSQQVN